MLALLALGVCVQLLVPAGTAVLPALPAALAEEGADGSEEQAADDGAKQEEAQPPAPEDKTQPDAPSADEHPPPEGVKRQRPKTGDEERAYKMRKTREDPYLTPPGGAGKDLSAYYNPQDYLAPLNKGYSARYMIQDAKGTMLGYMLLSVDLRTESSRDDTIYLSALCSNEPRSEMRLWLDARSFTPRRLERRTLRDESASRPAAASGPAGQALGAAGTEAESAAAPPGPENAMPSDPSQWSPENEPPRLNAEYLFDRVTIRHSSGLITVQRVLRQLPHSFELEAMPVLVRQIDCRAADWPFEAALTDARRLCSVPLSIDEPGWTELLSAEPLHYRCREFILHVGQQQLKYYVQSTPPYKLVQFTDGVYTYTLFEYASR
jgi:hypothetical protein